MYTGTYITSLITSITTHKMIQIFTSTWFLIIYVFDSLTTQKHNPTPFKTRQMCHTLLKGIKTYSQNSSTFVYTSYVLILSFISMNSGSMPTGDLI